MNKYDYFESIKEDVLDYIKENNLIGEDYDTLYNKLYMADSVTGNASYSYYCSSWKAEEALCHNLDLLNDACNMFGEHPDLSSPEACDVTIRCYLLGQVLREVLDEMEGE